MFGAVDDFRAKFEKRVWIGFDTFGKTTHIRIEADAEETVLLPSDLLETLFKIHLVPDESDPVILDKSIRAQAFWQDLKSQIAKAKQQIKSNVQFPKSQTKGIVIGSLRFIPNQNIRGQAWNFVIWDFWLVRVRY